MPKSIKKWWPELINKSKSFFSWLKKQVGPDIIQFLDDNKELALQLVIDAAKYYADKPGHFKFESVKSRLVEQLKQGREDIVIQEHWIHLLIEIAVAVAKATGKI